MNDRQSGRNGEYATVRIPAALRERADEVFRTYRGYEPQSAQESLSLLCDIAEGRIDIAEEDRRESTGRSGTREASRPHDESPIRDATRMRDERSARDDRNDGIESTDVDRPSGQPEGFTGPTDEPTSGEPTGPTAGETNREAVDIIEQVFPHDWDVDPTVAEYLPLVVEHYLENPDDIEDPAKRERDAIAAAAREADTGVDRLRGTLVTSLYGGAGFPDGLAHEFFSEALSEAAEVDSRPVAGVREAASDGGVASDSGGSIDSMLDDPDAEPTADCEHCGADHPVDDLETVIGPEDGSTVRLLCPDCAGD